MRADGLTFLGEKEVKEVLNIRIGESAGVVVI